MRDSLTVSHTSDVRAAQVDLLCALAERGISGGDSDCDSGIVAVAAAANPHRAWCAEIKAIGLQAGYARVVLLRLL